jgi:hypothetical protein
MQQRRATLLQKAKLLAAILLANFWSLVSEQFPKKPSILTCLTILFLCHQSLLCIIYFMFSMVSNVGNVVLKSSGLVLSGSPYPVTCVFIGRLRLLLLLILFDPTFLVLPPPALPTVCGTAHALPPTTGPLASSSSMSGLATAPNSLEP